MLSLKSKKEGVLMRMSGDIYYMGKNDRFKCLPYGETKSKWMLTDTQYGLTKILFRGSSKNEVFKYFLTMIKDKE